MKTETLRDLLIDPLCHGDDLGAPVPDSPHATSVALPLWEHVVGYEEKRPEVIDRLRAGYPRFAIHPSVRALWTKAEQEFATPGEQAIVLPSSRSASRCLEFIADRTGCAAHIHSIGEGGLCTVVFAAEAAPAALKFWQHFGDVVSSRRAVAALEGNDAATEAAKPLLNTLRARIAGFAGASPENTFLYTSGMGAMAAALRVLRANAPGKQTVQFGFPYVDGLKMQTVSGPGAHFFPALDNNAYSTIEGLAHRGEIAGVFCETPGNPLLETPDLARLSALLRPCGVPLVVDDTVASFFNVDVLPHADLLASSLTKLVSGVGDVMAGSLIVSHQSPLHDNLLSLVESDHESLLWEGDAQALEINCRDYPERAARVNATTAAVVHHLRAHPKVEHMWYPEGDAAYESIRRAEGGYGGLFSMVLREAESSSQPFYDRLRITKGPSLGTNFSLACPYTLLAHYDELEWAEGLGISRYLIRCAIGLEEPSDLIARFDEALDQSA